MHPGALKPVRGAWNNITSTTRSWRLINNKLDETHLDGFIMPEASFKIVSFVVSANRIPTKPKAASAVFRSAFARVGSALSPM